MSFPFIHWSHIARFIVGKDGRQISAQLLTAITGGWSGRILWQIPRSGSWTPAEKIRKARKPRISLYRLAGQMCPTTNESAHARISAAETLSTEFPSFLRKLCEWLLHGTVSFLILHIATMWISTLFASKPLRAKRPRPQDIASWSKITQHNNLQHTFEASHVMFQNCRKIWNANAIMTYIWHIMVPFGAIMCHRNDMPLVAISICHQGSAESSNRSWSSFTSCKDHPDGR